MNGSENNNEMAERLRQLEVREEFHRRILSDILNFSTRLTRNSDLKTLYRESNALAGSILGLDYSTLMILSDDGRALVIRDAIGFPSSMIDSFSLLEGQGLSTYVVKEKKTAVVLDFQVEKRFEVPPVVFREKIVSAIAVPMLIMGEVFGVMIGHTRRKRVFTPEEIDLYQSIANQSAVAIKNVMHFEALQDSEKRFRALFDRAGDAIFLADMDGKLVDVNETACRSLGYTREELLNMSVADVDPTFKEMNHQQSLWDNLPADNHVTITSKHRRKDGSLLPVEIRIGFLDLHNRNYILGFARDISRREQADSARRKLQGQLIQAQKMESIGTLAGGIAHDFNNILTPIFGYLELAMLETGKNSKLANHLTQVLRAAERAKEMVQQILAFSRSESEEISPLKADIIIKEALKLLRASIPTTIEIRENIDRHCGPVLANPSQVHQIVMNLCTNAYHAMRTTGGILGISLRPVEISTKDSIKNINLKPGPYLHLEVSDTGHGIAPEVLGRIFEPYFTTKQTGEGTGMGLSVVHGIVTGIGGHINVYSEQEKGTNVHVYLPVIAGEAFHSDDLVKGPVPTGTEKIMLVDDERTVKNVMKSMLINLGYSVEAFIDPREALTSFNARPNEFDLVITDMTMPQMTGDKLAQEIMTVRPDMPVILCSGFSDLINEESARALGIKGYITKPVTVQSFATIVRKTLDDSETEN